MDKEKIRRIAKMVEASAITFIGIFFISMGTTYFEEKLVYRLPRILLPVLDFFGHIGLAIAMILLGGGLICYGFFKWKSVNTKYIIFGIITFLGLIVGLTIAFVYEEKSKTSAEELIQKSENSRQILIEEIKESEKPDFKNPELTKHFARFDSLYQIYKKNVETDNQTAIMENQQAFMQWSSELAPLMDGLTTDEKVALARYNAKLGIMWSEVKKE